MSQIKGSEQAKLAQDYFQNLIWDAGAAPPPGLDPETVRLIRGLVEAEQLANPVTGLNFEAARQRIRQRVRPPVGKKPVDTRSSPAATDFYGSDLPAPVRRNSLVWGRFLTLAGMAATIVLLVGFLGLSLSGVKPPEVPPGVGSSPVALPTVRTLPATAAPSPTPDFITKSAADIFNPKTMLQKALVDVADNLSLDPNTLQKQLESGLSLAQVAKMQGVNLQDMKDILLSNFKAQLEDGLKSGQLTQQRADEIYKESSLFIDGYVDSVVDVKPKITPKP